MSHSNYFLIFVCAILFSACSATQPHYGKGEKDWAEKSFEGKKEAYSVYLMGALDYEHSGTDAAFSLLKNQTRESDSSHAIVFLNDRIYKNAGDDDIDETARKKNIDKQLQFLKEDKGKLIFIAGHDRAHGKKNYSYKSTRKFIEENTGKKDIFFPDGECAGPEKIKINDDIVLLALNTNYFLSDKDDDDSDCEINDETEWWEAISEEVDDNQRKNMLVLGHHPLIDLGNYGGWFSIKQHLFPLTGLNPHLYFPLPLIGTLYPVFRIAAGFKNDRSYPPNNEMRKQLIRRFYNYTNVVYAAGLEQNFQYFKYNHQDYLITSSADKPQWTGKLKSKFSYIGGGITKIIYLKNGEVWMECYVPSKDSDKGKLVFRSRLKDNKYAGPDDSTVVKPSEDVSDSVVTVVASNNFKIGKFKTMLLGEHYRKAWAAPVRFPVLDLQKESGGLEIIRKGGGYQTKSLQLKNKSGEEVTLRSVVKYPENLLGPMLSKTLAADIVRDQASSIHPYTPFIIDNLSDVAGVLHSDPKMVYIPNDAQLKEYRKEFANTLAVFEKKAGGNVKPVDNFDYAEEAVSSEKLMKRQKEDNSVVIDDYALLKSRLFDMWINDWDRHQGNWRWGKVKCDEYHAERCAQLHAQESFYVPIPRDRDQAFARFDGLIPWIVGRKWAGRRFQDFKVDVRDISGLNFNARNFDHAFLSRLTRKDWEKMALELKSELTDKKIESSIRSFPDTIYKIDGPRMITVLKGRRDNIPSFADGYYDYLAQYVDVRGSDQKESFKITRMSDDSTLVQMYDAENSNHLLYSRVLVTGETKEVRIYGRGGDDNFVVNGDVKKGILVRIIGGKGNDSLADFSFVRKGFKKTIFYDDKKKNTVITGKETRDRISSEKNVNDYKYYVYKYNLLAPALFFGYNPDDGLFIGGGVLLKKHGFRKEPYASKQRIVANVSTLEPAFNFRYLGDFIYVAGKWGLHFDVSVLAPKSITNFYGLGNETPKLSEDKAYYRLRYDDVYFYGGPKRRFGDHQTLKIGPVYEFINIEQTPGRFITSEEAVTYIDETDPHHLGGLKLEYEFQNVDDSVLTFRGIKWLFSAIGQGEFGKSAYSTSNLESQLHLYVPVANRATLAFRVGGAHRLGTYDFFQANILGGNTLKRENGNLRGYLRGRYSGRSSMYLNSDLRIKLFTLRTYLFPGHFGVLGFYDTGRVWEDNEKSKTWHNGYGGGIWFDPFARAIVCIHYATSKEEQMINVALGFLF